MPVISMDAMDHAASRRPTFHQRNVKSSTVETERRKTPSPLGYHVLRLMNEAGHRKVEPFAKVAGIGGSTLHRILYNADLRPDPDTLLRIARALAAAGAQADGESRTVEEIHQELLAAAGYRIGASVASRTIDPLALEIDDLLGEGSTLAETDRELLRTMIDRLIEPHRRRGRRRAG
jgi:transcriptional regulator with XRE-family HTH domain